MRTGQPFFMRTAKTLTLIRLGGCPGRSESSLGAQAILLVLSCSGSKLTYRKLDVHPTISQWYFFSLKNITHRFEIYFSNLTNENFPIRCNVSFGAIFFLFFMLKNSINKPASKFTLHHMWKCLLFNLPG